jgi:hypothetical protein
MRFPMSLRPAGAAGFVLGVALLQASLPLAGQNFDASCERERNLERELKKASQRRPAPEPRTTVTERTQPFS